MPRTRSSETTTLRQSPRAPLQPRTSSSESDGHHPHNRRIVDRSPKLADRRSPRTPVIEKKRGTRIADLEAQLSQTREELKKVKEQLAASEAEKRAQEELGRSSGTQTLSPSETQSPIQKSVDSAAIKTEESSPETDVFEVPVVTMPADPEPEQTPEQENEPATGKPLKSVESDEMCEMTAKLAEKERELEKLGSENGELKRQASEAAAEASTARAKAEEAALKLTRLGEELEEARGRASRARAELEAVEAAKGGLEAEMTKLRVQTEQWRKAADAAAAILSGDGRMIGERCGSMEKQVGGFDADRYQGLGSPTVGDDMDDGFGGGKRKGAGIRMFGDLWKKKGQK